jgi:hypothetical protein
MGQSIEALEVLSSEAADNGSPIVIAENSFVYHGRCPPGGYEVQLDLFGDYKSNISLYPAFQDYFRTRKPPFLAVWGEHDPFFLPAGRTGI